MFIVIEKSFNLGILFKLLYIFSKISISIAFLNKTENLVNDSNIISHLLLNIGKHAFIFEIIL